MVLIIPSGVVFHFYTVVEFMVAELYISTIILRDGASYCFIIELVDAKCRDSADVQYNHDNTKKHSRCEKW